MTIRLPDQSGVEFSAKFLNCRVAAPYPVPPLRPQPNTPVAPKLCAKAEKERMNTTQSTTAIATPGTAKLQLGEFTPPRGNPNPTPSTCPLQSDEPTNLQSSTINHQSAAAPAAAPSEKILNPQSSIV